MFVGKAAGIPRWVVLRVLLGTFLVAALIGPLSAAADASLQPTWSYEVKAYEAAHDVGQADAAHAVTIQHQGAGLVEQLEVIEGQSFAGVWFDNRTQQFVIPVADPKEIGGIRHLLVANRLGADYRLDPVRSTWDELVEAQNEINAELIGKIHDNTIQTGLDPTGNAVVIEEAADLDQAATTSIASIARGASVQVNIKRKGVPTFRAEPAACHEYFPEPPDIPRRTCDHPIRGGVLIEGSNNNLHAICSAGFAATGRQLGNHFVLTAGHCVSGMGQWRSEDGEGYAHYLGEVEAGAFPGHDYAAIRVKPAEAGNTNYWEEGPEGWVSRVVYWGGEQNIPIQYEAASYVGEQLCHSGTRTGASCGTVMSLNHTANYPGGTVYNLTETNILVDHGDSGGAFWTGNTALGLLSGFAEGTSISYFQEITEATDAMQVTVGTRLAAPPWAETTSPAAISGREATLQGEVDPAATPTNFHFDYGTSTSYGSSTPAGSAGSGHTPVAVSQGAQGLTPLTEYHYRIVAENSAGGAGGKDVTFKTTTAAPLASTGPPATRAEMYAVLTGELEAGGLETTYEFEYGLSETYGSVTESHTVAPSIGWAKHLELFTPLNLRPETTYHYRLKASNSKGTAYGEDRSFTTMATPPRFDLLFGTAGSGAGQLSTPVGSAVDAKGNMWVADPGNNRIDRFGPKGEPLGSIGSKGSGNGQLLEPSAVAVTQSGNLWVADTGNGRIEELGPSGAYITEYGVHEGFYGQDYLARPVGITIDPEEAIWVTDEGQQKVSEFTTGTGLDGHYRRSIDGARLPFGDSESTFLAPQGIASDSAGNIWVTDPRRNWVVELRRHTDPLGQLQYDPSIKISEIGSGRGQIDEPSAVVAKPNGNVFVVEKGNDRVQQFSPAGEFLSQFGKAGAESGQFMAPQGISLGKGGTIFVSDTGNNRIERWHQPAKAEATTEAATSVTATSATLTGTVNPSGRATKYQFEYGLSASYGAKAPASLTAVGSGADPVPVYQALSGLQPETVYHYRVVANNSVDGNVYGQEMTFTTAGPPYDLSFGSSGSGNGQFQGPGGAAVDSSGNLWVVDRGNNRVEKFSASGEYLAQFGSKGSGNGQFSEPRDIAISAEGNLWVTDAGNGRLEEFTSAGSFIRQVGTNEGTVLQPVDHLKEPYGLAIGTENRVWVTDPGKCSVVLFRETPSNNKYFLAEQKAFINPCSATEQGAFRSPTGVAVDSEGKAWVADAGLDRVTQLKVQTNEISGLSISTPLMFGAHGSGAGQLTEPAGIGVVAGNRLSVVDRGNNRVEQFSFSGEYLRQFGALGSGPEQFSGPRGIGVAPGGVQYVTDPGNNRVEKWG